MKELSAIFREHKQILFLVLAFILAEIFVNPIGDFPLNDDWAYAKALLTFRDKGEFNFGSVPAMTLCSHILWGFIFIKLFGFSFTVLRFSTLISAVIGAIFLYRLTLRISGNRMLSALLSVVLLFNPLLFSLSNTYMTDVNFNTLLIICCHLIYSFFQSQKKILLVLIFFAATALTLLRQYGIVLPVCFFISCFFIKDRKWLFVLLSLLVMALVFVVFKGYENYLKRILPHDAIYKFSGSYHLSDSKFWNQFFTSLGERYALIILHILFYLFPAAVIFLPASFRKSSLKSLLIAGIISVFFCLTVFWKVNFPYVNIFTNMKLGPEVFYESMNGSQHAYSEAFRQIMNVLKFVFPSMTMFVLLLFTSQFFRSIRWFSPKVVFFISLIAAYIFMILVTESYFDRYHIPLITLGLIFCAAMYPRLQVNIRWALVPLLLCVYVSIAGTKDYLELNRRRWEACNYLFNDLHVKSLKVNGGYEVNCWLEQSSWGYYNFQRLEGCDYLIQFKNEPGFSLFREYEFQRYFPFKKDKINIFVRDQKQHL
jgi:hypothetical protein